MRLRTAVLLAALAAVTVVPDTHLVHQTVEGAVDSFAEVAWAVARGAAVLGAEALTHEAAEGRGENRAERLPDGDPHEAGRAALSDRLTALMDRRADRIARSVPAHAERSLGALAAHLAAHAGPTMRGRTRAAFRWVTDHVSYDVGSARGWHPRADQSPAAVLHSHDAVCEGYARLFIALVERMGLEAAYISGHADPVGPGGGGRHAWVAVRLADGYYLIDPTWAAGHVRGERFVRAFNSEWWLVPPERMIRTHRPLDSRWALGAQTPAPREQTRSRGSRLLQRLLR